MMDTFTIIEGNCLEKMKGLDADSIDSIVTDPPYGLEFMGKEWDHGVPAKDFWIEALRVAKPGCHLLAFGGTRTYHRLAVAIEDAGWEIRDCIMWVYGSGFPKSHDVSKAIDKQGGGDDMPQHDRQDFAKELREKRKAAGITKSQLAEWFPQYSEVTKNWERLDDGFRVPSEPDYQVLVDRLGVSESWRLRVRAEDKRRLIADGLQDRRGDETVIGLGHSGKKWESTTDAAAKWRGWGTALKPAWEPIIVARKPLVGTVSENVLKHGTGGINIDGCRISTSAEDAAAMERANSPNSGSMRIDRRKRDGGHFNPLAVIGKMDTTKGRFPANFIHDGSEEVMRLFPHTTSGKPCGIQNVKSSTCGQSQAGRPLTGFGDSGSAARFFYCAKASRSDREEGLESDSGTLQQSVEFGQRKHGTLPYTEEIREQNPRPRANIHPTVKPTDLMRYLCRLVTPPNGIVLDPFMGSGSTGKAAMLEGFRFIGIELNPEYAEIASKRIQAVVEVKTDEPNLGELFE